MTVSFSLSIAAFVKMSHISHSASAAALRFRGFPEPTKLKSMLITAGVSVSSQSNSKLTGGANESCAVCLTV